MELGVFEFNTNAFQLYEKLGFKEFAGIGAFTWWQDICMEKYLEGTSINCCFDIPHIRKTPIV